MRILYKKKPKTVTNSMIAQPVKRLDKQEKEHQRQKAIRHDALMKKYKTRLNQKILESRRLAQQKQKQRLEIQMMEEKRMRQQKFFKTVLGNAADSQDRMQYQQMKDIPAEEFLDLCLKMEKMSISFKRENIRNKKRETSVEIERSHRQPTIRRQNSVSLNRKRESSTNPSNQSKIDLQNLKNAQAKLSKIIPRLTQSNTQNQSALSKILKIKLAQLQQTMQTHQRVVQQDEFDEQQRLFQLINRRKDAKYCFIDPSIWQLTNNIINHTIQQMKKCGNLLNHQKQRIETLFKEKDLSSKEYQNQKFNIFLSSSETENIFLSLKAQSFTTCQQIFILIEKNWENYSEQNKLGRQLHHLSNRMECFLQIFSNISSQINVQLLKIKLKFNPQISQQLPFIKQSLQTFKTSLKTAQMNNIHAVSQLSEGFTRFLMNVNSHLSLFDYLINTAIPHVLSPNIFQSPPAVLFPQIPTTNRDKKLSVK